MKRSAQNLVKATLKKFGYEIRRSYPTPSLALLGAAHLPINTVIDVGANEGQFAQFISTYFPKAAIFCFEPVPEPFAILKSWAATRDGRVTAVNCALGEAEGSFQMIKHDAHISSSSFLKVTPKCEVYYPATKAKSMITVNCLTLDSALRQYSASIQPEILIKLDVQGYEARVIRGGRQAFAKARVAVLEVSLVPLYESQPSFADIVRLMDEGGFDYAGSLDQICNTEGLLLSIDAVFFKRQ